MEENLLDKIYRDPWCFRSRRMAGPSHLQPVILNHEMKAIAVRECGSVVCIHFRLDGGDTFPRSGFVVESTLADGEYINIIFTADCIPRDNENVDVLAASSDIEINVLLSNGTTCIGELVGYDLYYNITAVKVKTPVLIPPLRLKEMDDSFSLDPNCIHQPYNDRFRFRLCPGDTVMALGRYSHHSCVGMNVLIVPGVFSVTPTEFECENLLRANCETGPPCAGGPLINRYGEVIGINFSGNGFTPFLPINIALLWWANFKKNGHCIIPRLGLNLKNMFLYPPSYLELVQRTFPKTFTGVVVDKVKSDELKSNEASTKILRGDIIIECDGKPIGGTLEFIESIWDKVGEHVRLTLLRPRDGCRLQFALAVGPS